MVLLYALQRFSLSDWGRHADFKENEKSVSHKIMIGDVDLELHTSHQDRLGVTRYALKGRATNAFPVTSKKLAKDHGRSTLVSELASLLDVELGLCKPHVFLTLPALA